MRVLHIVPAAFGRDGTVGGAERYAFELARHMAERVPTTMVTFGDSREEQRIGSLRVQTLSSLCYVKGERSNPLALSLLSEISQVDVVHCHQQHVVASSLASLFCRLTRRKAYVSDLGGGGWDVSAYISTDRWYHGHLHISQYSRTVFGQDDKPWAHVIYGGVDTSKFSPECSVPKDWTVLYAGRLLPHKGIDNLIRAMPEEIPLEIIGRPYDAPYHRELLRLADGKNVTFRHDCDDAALIEAYRRASCIVLPSVYKTMYGHETKVPELLGQTALEGMSCGTPAICTDVASLPEVVEDNVTGFLVPPNDPESLRTKILWLQDHPVEAQRMGQAARQRVLKQFSWPAVVDRCLNIYGSP